MLENTLNTLQQARLDTLDQMMLLMEEAASIKEQLTRASQKLRSTGEAAASDWYMRAVSARRAKLNQIRQLQAKLSRINHKIKVLNREVGTKLKDDQARKEAESEQQVLEKTFRCALKVCVEASELFDIFDAVLRPIQIPEGPQFKAFELCLQRLGEALDNLEDCQAETQTPEEIFDEQEHNAHDEQNLREFLLRDK